MKLFVSFTSLSTINTRCLFNFSSYSGVPSLPNFRNRSDGANLIAVLDGSISKKISSSDSRLKIGSYNADVKNNLAEI